MGKGSGWRNPKGEVKTKTMTRTDRLGKKWAIASTFTRRKSFTSILCVISTLLRGDLIPSKRPSVIFIRILFVSPSSSPLLKGKSSTSKSFFWYMMPITWPIIIKIEIATLSQIAAAACTALVRLVGMGGRAMRAHDEAKVNKSGSLGYLSRWNMSARPNPWVAL